MPRTAKAIEVGERIRTQRIEARRYYGITSEQKLAERMTEMGVPTTRRQVSEWERGERLPQVMHLLALSAVLRVPYEYLVEGSGPAGESEFIAVLRGHENDLTPKDRRMVLLLVRGMVAENKNADERAADDAAQGRDGDQRQELEDIDEENAPE